MQVHKNLWVRSGVIYLCRLHLPPTVTLLEHGGEDKTRKLTLLRSTESTRPSNPGDRIVNYRHLAAWTRNLLIRRSYHSQQAPRLSSENFVHDHGELKGSSSRVFWIVKLLCFSSAFLHLNCCKMRFFSSTLSLLAAVASATILQNGQMRDVVFPDTTIASVASNHSWRIYGPSASEISYKGRWDSKHISCKYSSTNYDCQLLIRVRSPRWP